MADAGQIMERELSLCRRDLQPTGNQRVPIRWCPAIHFLEPIAVHVTCRKPPSRALQQRFRNWVCTAIILLQLYRNMEQPQVNPKQPGTVLNGHGDGPEQHESHFGNFWTKKKPPGTNLAASIMVVPELLGQSYCNLLYSHGTCAGESD